MTQNVAFLRRFGIQNGKFLYDICWVIKNAQNAKNGKICHANMAFVRVLGVKIPKKSVAKIPGKIDHPKKSLKLMFFFDKISHFAILYHSDFTLVSMIHHSTCTPVPQENGRMEENGRE